MEAVVVLSFVGSLLAFLYLRRIKQPKIATVHISPEVKTKQNTIRLVRRYKLWKLTILLAITAVLGIVMMFEEPNDFKPPPTPILTPVPTPTSIITSVPTPPITPTPVYPLFNWERIPGNDNMKLRKSLNQNYNIDWVERSEIERIDNKTIRVYTGNNSLLLKLNNEKTKVLLTTSDGRTDNLTARLENNTLNIYPISAPRPTDIYPSPTAVATDYPLPQATVSIPPSPPSNLVIPFFILIFLVAVAVWFVWFVWNKSKKFLRKENKSFISTADFLRIPTKLYQGDSEVIDLRVAGWNASIFNGKANPLLFIDEHGNKQPSGIEIPSGFSPKSIEVELLAAGFDVEGDKRQKYEVFIDGAFIAPLNYNWSIRSEDPGNYEIELVFRAADASKRIIGIGSIKQKINIVSFGGLTGRQMWFLTTFFGVVSGTLGILSTVGFFES